MELVAFSMSNQRRDEKCMAYWLAQELEPIPPSHTVVVADLSPLAKLALPLDHTQHQIDMPCQILFACKKAHGRVFIVSVSWVLFAASYYHGGTHSLTVSIEKCITTAVTTLSKLPGADPSTTAATIP